MNPKWASSSYSAIDLNNEKGCVWLCDPEVWKEYKTSNSSYAIGSPSVEMYMRAYNIWKDNNENTTTLVNKVESANGYSVGANGEYANSGSYTNHSTIQSGPNNIFMTAGPHYWWLASPSSYGSGNMPDVYGGNANVGSGYYDSTIGICPIVPLDL